MRSPSHLQPVLSATQVSAPEADEGVCGLLDRYAVPAPPVAGDVLTALRAVMALERIGTDEAQRILARLAASPEDGLLALQARAALDRLSRR